MKARLGFALCVALATATLYAEGVLKDGWIEVALLAPVVWFSVSPRSSGLFKNLLLSLMVVCLTVTTIDLVLRPLLERRLNYTPLNVYARKLPTLSIVGRWDPNLSLVDTLYGDLAALVGVESSREPRQIVFQTDDAGFRNSRVPEQIELLVLGDSFGAGWGTTQNKIFASLLQEKYGVRTYNLSYPGGPYDQYVNFTIEWSRLSFVSQPKLVWTFFTGNDFDDPGGEVWDVAALPWNSRIGELLVKYRTFRNRSPLNRMMEGMRHQWHGDSGVVVRTLPDGRPVLFLAGYEAWAAKSREEVEHHQNFSKLERTLKAMLTLTRERQIDVTILLLPTKGEVYRWIWNERAPRLEDAESSGFARAILGLCGRVQLRCLDTKPFLVAEARRLFDSSGELMWWRDDSHLGERGHEAIAAFISQHVLNSHSNSLSTTHTGDTDR